MKKIIALALAALLLVSMTACQGGGQTANDKYVVGICQIATFEALDDATNGFKAALIEELGEENVEFKMGNAAGEYSNCQTIIDGYVADEVDLILANATAPLQAAVAATADIPILGTSVTDYATALKIDNWTGTVGGNVSGTTDLAPLTQQADMILELIPEAKTVGLLYCTGEPNSVFQITEVENYLATKNITCKRFGFNDVNDLASVTQTACDQSDVIYIPTDNTAANNTEAIANVVLAEANKTPVIAGESGICNGCGIATLSISYYDLGWTTGKMAAKILKGEADISTMAIESAPEAIKKYNATNCQALGITVPSDYEALS